MNLDLRTKKTVGECITTNNIIMGTGTVNVRYVEYQPGNGTRYRLLFTVAGGLDLSEVEPIGGWLVTNLNSMRSMFVASIDQGLLHFNYVQAKLDIGISDAICLAEVIAFFTSRTSMSCEEVTELAKDW